MVNRPKSKAVVISTISNAPRQPNVCPRQPYFDSEPAGSGVEISTAIKPISGVKIAEIINAQPKPMLRRLPKSPTNTSSRMPEAKPKNAIPHIRLLFNSFPFHTIECSERQLLTGSICEI